MRHPIDLFCIRHNSCYIISYCIFFFCPFKGKLPQVQIPDDWITMVDPCIKKMKEQVQEEFTAAMTYFAMVNDFELY